MIDVERTWLVKYADSTLDTIDFTELEVEALRLHPGIDEVLVLVDQGVTISLDEAALLF